MRTAFLLTTLILTLFTRCSSEIETDTTCDFAPASSNWADLEPIHLDDYACSDCFITVEFRNQRYQFENNQLQASRRVTGNEHLYQTISYSNAFLTFTVVIPDQMDELEQSLNQETTLLAYEELFAADQRDLPGISTYLRVENYCRDRFEVAASKQDESINITQKTEIISQQEFLMGQDENSLRPVRESTLRVEGMVSGYLLVEDEIVPISVNYRVPAIIIEWTD